MQDLKIHAASEAELIEAHRNVFDIWSKGLPREEHIKSRLNSPKHTLARWYVGTLDGRVVVSLGFYPLLFSYRSERIPGGAIGSVYTVPEFRGQGFAPALLRWVEQHERGLGARISLLYSDIGVDYYQRLGYAACPALEGWLDPRSSELQESAYRLDEISAAERWPELARLYATYHEAMPLCIARDEAYWQALLARFPEERFFVLADRNDAWHGYLRLACKDNAWRITDYALADQSLELAEELYALAISLASEQNATRFGGWLPDHPSARQFFDLTPRKTEITMLKSLSDACPLDDVMLELASRFCEIDHV